MINKKISSNKTLSETSNNVERINDIIQFKTIFSKKQLKTGIYVVSTPIGNLEDITLRALKILNNVDLIACEDKRVSSKLLSAYSIKKPLIVYNDVNKDKMISKILEEAKTKSIALISDAGTPLISDPGFKLIRSSYEEGVKIESIPGASSVINALVLSGLPTDSFYFGGFLPVKSGKKKTTLENIPNDATYIFFESPHRILKTLEMIKEVLPKSQVCITREMTKMFEEISKGLIDEVLEIYKQKPKVKGEIVLLISNK